MSMKKQWLVDVVTLAAAPYGWSGAPSQFASVDSLSQRTEPEATESPLK
jgi:hypothetical protein